MGWTKKIKYPIIYLVLITGAFACKDLNYGTYRAYSTENDGLSIDSIFDTKHTPYNHIDSVSIISEISTIDSILKISTQYNTSSEQQTTILYDSTVNYVQITNVKSQDTVKNHQTIGDTIKMYSENNTKMDTLKQSNQLMSSIELKGSNPIDTNVIIHLQSTNDDTLNHDFNSNHLDLKTSDNGLNLNTDSLISTKTSESNSQHLDTLFSYNNNTNLTQNTTNLNIDNSIYTDTLTKDSIYVIDQPDSLNYSKKHVPTDSIITLSTSINNQSNMYEKRITNLENQLNKLLLQDSMFYHTLLTKIDSLIAVKNNENNFYKYNGNHYLKNPNLTESDPNEISKPNYKDVNNKSANTSKVLIDTLFYDIKKISPSNYNEAIKSYISFIKNNPSVRVYISSYTDSSGPESFNNQLSLERANFIKKQLVKQTGIDERQIFIQYFGETYTYPLPLDEDRKVILTIKSN